MAKTRRTHGDHKGGTRRRSSRTTISATAAAKTFGTLVDRVREARTAYVVERGGVPVAEIRPVAPLRFTVADLVDLLRTKARHDEAFLEAVEAGMAAFNRPAVPPDRWES